MIEFASSLISHKCCCWQPSLWECRQKILFENSNSGISVRSQLRTYLLTTRGLKCASCLSSTNSLHSINFTRVHSHYVPPFVILQPTKYLHHYHRLPSAPTVTEDEVHWKCDWIITVFFLLRRHYFRTKTQKDSTCAKKRTKWSDSFLPHSFVLLNFIRSTIFCVLEFGTDSERVFYAKWGYIRISHTRQTETNSVWHKKKVGF